jgi:hypothetical protein
MTAAAVYGVHTGSRRHACALWGAATLALGKDHSESAVYKYPAGEWGRVVPIGTRTHLDSPLELLRKRSVLAGKGIYAGIRLVVGSLQHVFVFPG